MRIISSLILVSLLFISGCAWKPTSKTMLVSPFTKAEFETGGKINAGVLEVLLK